MFALTNAANNPLPPPPQTTHQPLALLDAADSPPGQATVVAAVNLTNTLHAAQQQQPPLLSAGATDGASSVSILDASGVGRTGLNTLDTAAADAIRTAAGLTNNSVNPPLSTNADGTVKMAVGSSVVSTDVKPVGDAKTTTSTHPPPTNNAFSNMCSSRTPAEQASDASLMQRHGLSSSQTAAPVPGALTGANAQGGLSIQPNHFPSPRGPVPTLPPLLGQGAPPSQYQPPPPGASTSSRPSSTTTTAAPSSSCTNITNTENAAREKAIKLREKVEKKSPGDYKLAREVDFPFLTITKSELQLWCAVPPLKTIQTTNHEITAWTSFTQQFLKMVSMLEAEGQGSQWPRYFYLIITTDQEEAKSMQLDDIAISFMKSLGFLPSKDDYRYIRYCAEANSSDCEPVHVSVFDWIYSRCMVPLVKPSTKRDTPLPNQDEAEQKHDSSNDSGSDTTSQQQQQQERDAAQDAMLATDSSDEEARQARKAKRLAKQAANNAAALAAAKSLLRKSPTKPKQEVNRSSSAAANNNNNGSKTNNNCNPPVIGTEAYNAAAIAAVNADTTTAEQHCVYTSLQVLQQAEINKTAQPRHHRSSSSSDSGGDNAIHSDNNNHNSKFAVNRQLDSTLYRKPLPAPTFNQQTGGGNRPDPNALKPPFHNTNYLRQLNLASTTGNTNTASAAYQSNLTSSSWTWYHPSTSTN